jgi:hypothetical protein
MLRGQIILTSRLRYFINTRMRGGCMRIFPLYCKAGLVLKMTYKVRPVWQKEFLRAAS